MVFSYLIHSDFSAPLIQFQVYNKYPICLVKNIIHFITTAYHNYNHLVDRQPTKLSTVLLFGMIILLVKTPEFKPDYWNYTCSQAYLQNY